MFSDNIELRRSAPLVLIAAAGILLFGTGLGGLITGLIAIVTPLIPLLLGAVKVLMLNPWVAGAVALGLGAWGIHSLVSSHQSNKAQKVETGDDLDTTPSTEIQAGATQDRSAANKKEQPEQKFANFDELASQIKKDIEKAKIYHGI